ncbi:MAG: sugar ABC transporter substrate-binding protein [Micrococcales bacterium 70-64]|jgi:alpha-glucoside transport system substrate-binding protein|nr:extracellular solute-binding protein [Leifsonia sp.]ODU63312.1 MAG: sugar ABC transporter substrate-binding protein [Leifsonia sp. SCN 70-46]OJX85003.1 MAG: sugar ABC transporter substrate-binding protein [Micrococcales bacterium 70-64]
MSFTVHRRFAAPLAVLAVAGLALAGCSADGGDTGSGPGDAGEADGVVTVYGTIQDTEADLLEQSWADWEKANNIDIQYEGSKEFEAQIGTRAQGGTAPDLAIFPQPGLLADLASRGYVQPAPEGVSKNVADNWSTDWAGYATVDGTLYGAPLMASVKGFVWYSPSQFKEWGVEVPTTWQELLDLTKTIQSKTGTAPWCAGFGSDAATGWPGTDWVEDLVLRQAGPDVYDQWVKHEIPFNDPAIKSAFDSVGEILLNPDYVNAGFGDVKSINTTPFGDPARALGDGSCALHHQASFYDGFIQDPANGNATVGPDADIWAFILPGETAGAPAVTGGGEIVAAFSNDADTIKVQEYLSSADWANSRVALGGVISANKGLDASNASSPILQEAIKILQDPNTTFRFDASDLMPGVVGAGTFWTGMVDWVNGKSTDEVLSNIEASWPSE